MPFGPDQIPIVVPPVPGEALDSWVAAYARRLRCTITEFLGFLGLNVRAGQLLTGLRPEERDTLTRATGVDHAVLIRMTLRPLDGLAVTINQDTRGLAFPPAWRRTAGSRYCPSCLRDTGGRWQLTWRLPWSFACSRHGMLLVETCPACQARPVPCARPRTQAEVTSASTCTTPFSLVASGKGRPRPPCGQPLVEVAGATLPPGGLVLAAHHHVERLLHQGAAASDHTAKQTLDELFVLAWRALAAVQTQRSAAPPIAEQIMDECGGSLPHPLTALDAEDAHAVAVGTTLARIAHQQDHPASEPVLRWIVEADRGRRDYANLGILLQPWRRARAELTARVLAVMDPYVRPSIRLRYASASPHPRFPTVTDAQLKLRARMVPATLWPSWSMRLLDTTAFAVFKPDGFRAALSALLLLPGTTTTITYQHAVQLLGGPANAITATKTIMGTFDQAHLQPLLSCLAQLAAALDTHGSPIDYARRRATFTPATTAIDREAYERLCARQGWLRPSQHRLRLLDGYLLALLTGTYHISTSKDPTTTRDRVRTDWNRLRYRMPAELREFFNTQARASLKAYRINEPVCWEPPARWVTGVTWPGIDPDHIDQQRLRDHAASRDTAQQLAQALHMSLEHLRLYADITGVTVPEQRQGKRSLRTPHQGPLTPDRLRDLYEHQQLSVEHIAELAGCSPHVASDALRLAGIQTRPAFRQRSLPITREWLEEEYVHKQRTLVDIAHELGTSRPRVTSYVKKWDLPLQPRGHVPDPLARLSGHERLALEIRAAFTGQDAVERIRRIIQLPGHRSIRAAAAALGITSTVLEHQLRIVEQAAGFKIIERAERAQHPVRLTPSGQTFIQEAQRALQLLDAATANRRQIDTSQTGHGLTAPRDCSGSGN